MHSQSGCQSLVAWLSRFPWLSNFACTFLQQHLNPLPATPFSIIRMIQWQPVLECRQTNYIRHLSAQGSIWNLIQMVLPPDNGPMLLLEIPRHPFFLPLVECTVVGLAHHFGKLLQWEFSLLQADWWFAICTAQVRQIVALITYILLVVGHLQQWGQVQNPCNICFMQFR